MSTKYCFKCKADHPTDNFGKDRTRKDGLHACCKQCIKTYNKSHKDRNPSYHSEYYHANKDEVLAANTKWRASNHEHDLSVKKRYRAANKHILTACNARRRASIIRAIPIWFEDSDVTNLYHKCNELNRIFGTELEVDHIIPIQHPLVCGLHCLSNLQLLDQNLNRVKSNRFQQDW